MSLLPRFLLRIGSSLSKLLDKEIFKAEFVLVGVVGDVH